MIYLCFAVLYYTVCGCVYVQLCLLLFQPHGLQPTRNFCGLWNFHGISQARILEWVAISSSRASSQLRNQTHISCVSRIGGWILYHCATWKAHIILHVILNNILNFQNSIINLHNIKTNPFQDPQVISYNKRITQAFGNYFQLQILPLFKLI